MAGTAGSRRSNGYRGRPVRPFSGALIAATAGDRLSPRHVHALRRTPPPRLPSGRDWLPPGTSLPWGHAIWAHPEPGVFRPKARPFMTPAVLRAPFVGAWRLLRYEYRRADGKLTLPFGESPVGLLIYDALGHMAGQLMRRGLRLFARTRSRQERRTRCAPPSRVTSLIAAPTTSMSSPPP